MDRRKTRLRDLTMTKILLLLSSPRGTASLSTKAATALADRLTTEMGAELTIRDLAAESLPHIDGNYTLGRFLEPDQRSADQNEAVNFAASMVDQLMAADIIIIAASMINFAPSTPLKAWIDHIVWPGRTMVPTHNGPKGLITGKKAYVVAASGGVYSSGPMESADHLVPYIRLVLGFIGITDVEAIRVEAQSFGPEKAEKGVASAFEQVRAIAIPFAAERQA
jgi:FMN-dependent NADH-azoreductase